ncbi:MAG: hypothetical protein COA58_00230 [Bacteroidetes bacterium]|nr:MAG: hypothetical protein COA58_00230 [Bacteroidota bacterium]
MWGQLIAQKELDNWHFGNKCAISFGSGMPTTHDNSKMNAIFGCSSISDFEGKLLFYTNGKRVWNHANKLMEDGEDLSENVNPVTGSSRIIIIPLPYAKSIYYIFTIERNFDSLYYSIIDMKMNNGFGKVITRHQSVAKVTSSHLCAIQSEEMYWIVVSNENRQGLVSYKFNRNGLESNPIQSFIGKEILPNGGHISGNSIGNQIAISTINGFGIMDFDVSKGKASNLIVVDSLYYYNGGTTQIYRGAYGLAFSPDNRFIYTTVFDNNKLSDLISGLYQYDLSVLNESSIKNSEIIIDQRGYWGYADLQTRGDSIYLDVMSSDFLGIIGKPNSKGLAAQFNFKGVYLKSGRAGFNLPVALPILPIPNWSNAYIKSKEKCEGKSAKITLFESRIFDSVRVDFGDGVFETFLYPDTTFNHVYLKRGIYHVQINFYYYGYLDSVEQALIIKGVMPFDLGPDRLMCKGKGLYLELSSTIDSFQWNDKSPVLNRNIIEQGEYILTTFQQCGNYEDTVIVDFENCINLAFIPNAFTPNNDQLNGVFRPVGTGITYVDIEIYNRWGELIFKEEGPHSFWAASNEPAGVYMYKIQITYDLKGVTRSEIKAGTVHVIR